MYFSGNVFEYMCYYLWHIQSLVYWESDNLYLVGLIHITYDLILKKLTQITWNYTLWHIGPTRRTLRYNYSIIMNKFELAMKNRRLHIKQPKIYIARYDLWNNGPIIDWLTILTYSQIIMYLIVVARTCHFIPLFKEIME